MLLIILFKIISKLSGVFFPQYKKLIASIIDNLKSNINDKDLCAFYKPLKFLSIETLNLFSIKMIRYRISFVKSLQGKI